MIEKEIERSIQQFETRIKPMGFTIDQYLQAVQKTPQDFRKEFMVESKQRVLNSLVLDSIVQAESITASPEELDAEVSSWNMKGIQTVADVIKTHPGFQMEVLTAAVTEKKALKLVLDQAKTK